MKQRERILLMRLSSLGDLILCTPCIRVLREHLPQAHIAMLTEKRFAPLFECDPNINEMLIFDREDRRLGGDGMIGLGREVWRRFDISIDLHGKFRTALLGILSGAKRRIGYAGRFSTFYTDSTPDNPSIHVAEAHLNLLRPIGIGVKDVPPSALFVPPETSIWAEEEMLRRGIGRDKLRFGIFPGAGWESKRWRPERFAAVADLTIERFDAQVLIFTSSPERWIAERMREAMSYEPIIFDDMTLLELAALISRCDLFLSNDTGPMHIASAVGVTTIGLFGPGDPSRFAPFTPDGIALKGDVPCSPCRDFKRCDGRRCMDAISVKTVWGKVEEICEGISERYW
jgi:ADP-heptose:LPS heptosyltransferase